MVDEIAKIEEDKEEEFKIPVEELFSIFEEHLGEKNNSRILFSGKFGIGKTYFLNEFFKSEEYKNKYEVFHLYPVNYQISSNEDVIELLKYDILVELFNRSENSFFEQDENVKLTKSLITWSKDNSLDIVKNAISYIPKIGKPLNETIGLLTRFEKFYKESKDKDLKVIENFLQDSNIVETDFLSEILKNKIVEQKNNKKSVLILDDLDRIDPEHIFRILNIFSAHFDSDNKELPNKFGFDKIILVGDYSNLKSIFHHKYGKDTDESGYFDKFYSQEIFQFKNEELIEKFINEIISKIKTEDKNIKESLDAMNGYLGIFLKSILLKSLKISDKEKLNLRRLLIGIKFQLFKDVSYNNGVRSENYIIQTLRIGTESLISIFGGNGSDDLLKVLNKIKLGKFKNDAKYRFDDFLVELLIIFIPSVSKTGSVVWRKYIFKLDGGDILSITNSRGKTFSKELVFYEMLIEYVEEKHYLKNTNNY